MSAHVTTKCALEILTNKEALIKSRWVRPEDLVLYDSLGYSRFVLAGREMSTEWIVNAVKAYAERRYEGNLIDILSAPFLTGETALPREVKRPFIDNQKLGGFLEFFKTVDCRHHCHDCLYCRQVADEAVSTFEDENRVTAAALTEMRTDAFDGGPPRGQGSDR